MWNQYIMRKTEVAKHIGLDLPVCRYIYVSEFLVSAFICFIKSCCLIHLAGFVSRILNPEGCVVPLFLVKSIPLLTPRKLRCTRADTDNDLVYATIQKH
jgi:hypothetical protein